MQSYGQKSDENSGKRVRELSHHEFVLQREREREKKRESGNR